MQKNDQVVVQLQSRLAKRDNGINKASVFTTQEMNVFHPGLYGLQIKTKSYGNSRYYYADLPYPQRTNAPVPLVRHHAAGFALLITWLLAVSC
jgi:hypothetical protein